MSNFYMKIEGGVVSPIDDECRRFLSKISSGEIVSVDIKRPRNINFHRLYFSLLSFAYDNWEPDIVKFHGVPVGKNMDVFRGWVIAMAGYYELGITPDGKVKANPMSISFAKMSQETFEDLYSKTIDVILKHVLKNYKDRAELERVLERIVGYM